MSDTNIPRSSYDPVFMAPRGRGRPPEETSVQINIPQFSDGCDTYYDPMAARGFCHLTINTRSYQGRTLDKRRGYQLHGNNGGNGAIYLMDEMKRANDFNLFLRIVSTSTPAVKLQRYNPTANSWEDVGGEWGDINSQTDFYGVSTFISGEARFYFCNGVDELRYTDGNTVYTVTDGADSIIPTFITSVENVLVIGRINDGHHGANEILFSKAGTHQFRRDVDLTYPDSSQKIVFDDEITSVRTLGWLVYIHTPTDGLWELDLSTQIPRAISTHGTLSPKSVAIGHNTMIWADQYSIWGLTLGSGIQRLGDTIDNFYNRMLGSNIPHMNGIITPSGQYKLWIGNVTYEDVSYTDVVLVFDIEASRIKGQRVWRIDTNKPSRRWANWINNSYFNKEYFAHRTEQNIYQDEVGQTDAGEEIISIWQSIDFPIRDEKTEIMMQNFYFKVNPDDVEEQILEVNGRVDMGDWILQNKVVVEEDNKVDMKIIRTDADRGMTGRTFSIQLKIGGTNKFTIYEMMMTYNWHPSEIHPSPTTI